MDKGRWDDVYHIVMRGITRRQVFLDEEDCAKMVALLKYCKGIGDFTLYAYCVAGDALHMLIGLTRASVKLLFGTIEQVYVPWYNGKYERSGAVFEERLKCIPVNCDEDLIDDMVTIHLEPVRQGFVKAPGAYPYSSFQDYRAAGGKTLTSTGCLKALIPEAQFDLVHALPPRGLRLTEKNAWALAKLLAGVANAAGFRSLAADAQGQLLRTMNARGVQKRILRHMMGLTPKVLDRLLAGSAPAQSPEKRRDN
ncbi:MAG: hypothetical protein RR452_02475 [Clostridia bacterium]